MRRKRSCHPGGAINHESADGASAPVAIVVGLTLGGMIAFYTFTTYMQKFLVNTSGFRKTPRR
jgi:hypothetical protein